MSEQFKLPDGTMVGTGNIKPESLPNLFSSFSDKFDLLSDIDCKRLLVENGEQRYKKLRVKRRETMINQGSVGKCNTSAAVAGYYQISDRNGHKHVPLADNYMYLHINDGQDRGSLLHHSMAFGRSTGISPRTLTSRSGAPIGEIGDDVYNKRQVPRDVLRAANNQAGRFKFWEPHTVPEDFSGFRQTVMTALALGYPIVNAWDVTSGSMQLNNGYIVSGRGMGNHATLFHSAKWVGGQDGVHPDTRNSWGPTSDAVYGAPSQGWGDGGFGLMTMAQAYHCRQWHEFYVITGCTEDTWESIF